MTLEGCIKKIEKIGKTTVVTLEIVPPKKKGVEPDEEDYGSTEMFLGAVEDYKAKNEDYNRKLFEIGRLRLGLVTLSQEQV